MHQFLEWVKEVIRPVVINLLTAVLLFIAAVVYKTNVLQLFGLDRVEGYPIVCAAEMYQAPDDSDGIWLDFYLINNSGNQFDTRSDLINRLKGLSPDPDLKLLPDIQLTINEGVADRFRITDKMKQAAVAFNHGKGEATVNLANDSKTVIIRVRKIGPYNALKATVAIDGFRRNLGKNRGLVPSIPIENRDSVFERCYTVYD